MVARRQVQRTVDTMDDRRHRGYTIVELVAIVSLTAVLATVTVSSLRPVVDAVRDSNAHGTLRAVAAGEDLIFRAHNRFSSATSALAALEPAYTYVSATEPSTAATEVSVAVDTLGGVDRVGFAVRSSSGRCILLQIREPRAVDPDSLARLAATDAAACTGTEALELAAGLTSW